MHSICCKFAIHFKVWRKCCKISDMIKTRVRIFIGIILCLFFVQTHASGQKFEKEIYRTVKEGNAVQLVSYFNDPVNMKISGVEGIYSAEQSRVLLKKFFKKYPPKGFEPIISGSSDMGDYSIGEYKRKAGKSFRIYFLMMKQGKTLKVYQFYIEEE